MLRMMKLGLIFLLGLWCGGPLFAQSMCPGTLDIVPQYMMMDGRTPLLIHFCASSSSLSSSSYVFTKARLNVPGNSSLWNNAQSWSTTNRAWNRDSAVSIQLMPLTVNRSTVSGWLYIRSSTSNVFGECSVSIRFYKKNDSTSIDVSQSGQLAVKSIIALDSTRNGGWLEGTMSVTSGLLVMAKDSTGTLLSLAQTEDNGVYDFYPSNRGYFKLPLPSGAHTIRLEIVSSETGEVIITSPYLNLTIRKGDVTPVSWIPACADLANELNTY